MSLLVILYKSTASTATFAKQIYFKSLVEQLTPNHSWITQLIVSKSVNS